MNTQESIVRQVSSRVAHHGTCISSSHSPLDLNPCGHLTPCKNGGTCSTGDPNQYSCACSSGYTGTDCEEDIDECKMSPCANQATCIVSDHNTSTQKGLSGYELRNLFFPKNHPGSYQCLCVRGWTGEVCETIINDCSSQPCQNGGNCSDLINDYYCTCPVEYAVSVCYNNLYFTTITIPVDSLPVESSVQFAFRVTTVLCSEVTAFQARVNIMEHVSI